MIYFAVKLCFIYPLAWNFFLIYLNANSRNVETTKILNVIAKLILQFIDLFCSYYSLRLRSQLRILNFWIYLNKSDRMFFSRKILEKKNNYLKSSTTSKISLRRKTKSKYMHIHVFKDRTKQSQNRCWTGTGNFLDLGFQ